MADRLAPKDAKRMTNLPNDAEQTANSGLMPQLGMMIRALWAAPVRNTLLLLSGLLFLVIAATAFGQIRINSWNQPFYDALSHRDFEQFLVQLGISACWPEPCSSSTWRRDGSGKC